MGPPALAPTRPLLSTAAVSKEHFIRYYKDVLPSLALSFTGMASWIQNGE
jgi:hypothetical protein